MRPHGDYVEEGPTRDEIDATRGPVVLEFGANWCGFCQAARPLVESAFADYPAVEHIKVTDGPGRPLGRSFRVKLWPTLVYIENGTERGRVVRPGDPAEIEAIFAS